MSLSSGGTHKNGGWPKGKKCSEDTKKKISMALKGRKLSEEHKHKISESLKGEKNPMYGKLPWNKGKRRSKETRRKISEHHVGMIGKKHTEESKRKISEANKAEKHPMWGKKHSKESKQKMSESQKGEKHHMWGKKHTEETKRKISEAKKGEKNHNWGKTPSEETKRKLSRARLNRVFSTKDTSIEVAMQAELDERNISYEKHIPVCNICQPDIVFPDKRVVVQCDGNYWHSKEFDNGRAWRKDRHQDKVLRESGWTVIRFWESEINDNASHCVDIVEAALVGGFKNTNT